MKNAFKSLKRMRLMAFLIILQLSIGLSLLNSTAITIDETNKKLSTFEKLFNYEKTYMISLENNRSKPEMITLSENNEQLDNVIMKGFEMRYNFYLELQKLKGKNVLKNVSTFYSASDPLIDGLDKIETKYSDLHGSQKRRYTSRVQVNNDFIKEYDLKLLEGRSFIEGDFNIDYRLDSIPIIIGKDYSHSAKIGDKFNGKVRTGLFIKSDIDKKEERNLEDTISNKQVTINEEADVTYEIIGIYDHNAIPSLMTSHEIISNLNYSDSLILIPTVKDLAYLNESTTMESGGLFIEVNDDNYIKYIEEKFTDELEKNRINLEIKPLKEEFDAYKESLVKNVVNSIALGGTLTLLSIIGITSVLLGELNKRKKEFGIRIATGANIRTLCKELVFEILIMITMATLLSIIMLYIKQVVFNVEGLISTTVLLIDIGIIGVLTIIISIVPIFKIRKMNPIELVRGK